MHMIKRSSWYLPDADVTPESFYSPRAFGNSAAPSIGSSLVNQFWGLIPPPDSQGARVGGTPGAVPPRWCLIADFPTSIRLCEL